VRRTAPPPHEEDDPISTPAPYADELAFAHELVDIAARITRHHVEHPVQVRHKEDATPVTDADIAVELALREATSMRFPGDGFVGEEGGRTGSSHRTWIVDPIDGTKNFVDGIQVWATLVALEVDGTVMLGVVDAPHLGERYDAVRDQGARLNFDPIEVSDVPSLAQAFVLHSGVEEWLRGSRWDAFVGVVGDSRRTRGLSDFWGHVLVARGSADVLLEHEPCGVWDWAALRVVLEEAGGRMTTLDGEAPYDGCTLLSTNGRVHDEVLDRLRSGVSGSA
jgi:histidinol-phosphatase